MRFRPLEGFAQWSRSGGRNEKYVRVRYGHFRQKHRRKVLYSMINAKRYPGSVVFSLLAFPLLAAAAGTASADKMPPLWGYGVKTCGQYLQAVEGEGGAQEEFRRYQDWLTGFVSGLNLATGKDVLKGADIDSAMRRIRAHCGGNRKDDFFAATMDLVRMLSGLR